MPAKTPPIQTVADSATRNSVEAIAKAKGLSVSELTRGYIEKGMVVDLPMVQGPHSGGWPSYADLGGTDQAVFSSMALRFGLSDQRAEELVGFLAHVLESRKEQNTNTEIAGKGSTLAGNASAAPPSAPCGGGFSGNGGAA